jgi:rhomboid protease GluP
MSLDGGLELWRLITPIFLHVGIFHLALNMLGQIPLGFDLERSIGTWRFIIVYFISGI